MSKNKESRKKNNPKGRDRGSANRQLQDALEGRNKEDDHLSAAYMNNNTAAVDVTED